MKKIFIISFFLVLGFCVILALLYFIGLINQKLANEKNDKINARTQKSIELIIPVMEKYKKDKGKYPAALIDLVPAYMPALPQTEKKYYYERHKKGYHLYFISLTEIINNVCYYSSEDKTWFTTEDFDRPSE
jgi:hypothetical protein